jgi:hypothetical protein
LDKKEAGQETRPTHSEKKGTTSAIHQIRAASSDRSKTNPTTDESYFSHKTNTEQPILRRVIFRGLYGCQNNIITLKWTRCDEAAYCVLGFGAAVAAAAWT